MKIHPARIKWMEDLLAERFGQKLRLTFVDDSLVLQLAGEPGKILFDTIQPAFMHPGKPRDLKCEWWEVELPLKSILGERKLPAVTFSPLLQPLIEKNSGGFTCHYDILGLAFWMMNRLEEVDTETLDEHQRFPANESHAEQNGYLDRPVVDEWLDILGQMIQSQWPKATLKKHEFKMSLSHDVDRPSRYGFASIKSLVRAVVGDVIKRKDLSALFVAPWVRLNSKRQLHSMDTFNTFHWIMDQSDNAGATSTFNFICDTDYGPYEADYQLEHPAIRKLIRDIHLRGHRIGLHPSYKCYLNPEKIDFEFRRLRKVCKEEGIEQTEWGGRMHYLRWSHPETLRAWEKAGLNYDSTLGFAGKAGFRCGTAYEFHPFDIKSEVKLKIREKPLIVMEGTVLAKKYMAVKNSNEAQKVFNELKEKCQRVNGQFNLLWHNSELVSVTNKAIYKRVISS